MNTSIPVNNRVSNSKTYSKTYFRKFLELCLVVTLLLSVGFLASCKKRSVTSGLPPSAPTSLNAVSGISNATISWVNPTNAGYANDGVTPLELKSISVIYTKSNSQTINTLGSAVETITLGTNRTSVVISNLAPDTDYLYTVVVVNNIEEAATSDIKQFRTFTASPPAAPANLTVTARSATELDVSFTGGVGATSHTVKWKVSTASSYSAENSVTGNSHTITGLTASTEYDVVVTAVNTVGTTPATVVKGTTASAATSPGQPGSIDFTSVTTSGFTATWAAPSDAGKNNDGSPYTGTITYTVTINPSNSTVTISGTSATNRTFTGLTTGTEYTVTVTPSNPDGGAGSVSSAKQTTPVAAPGAPTGITVTAKAGSSTELDVSFTAGSGAASHSVKWKVSTASTYAGGDTATVTGTGNSHIITGLTAKTEYDVVVAAVNAGGTTEAAIVKGTTAVSEADISTKIANTQNLGTGSDRGSFFGNSASAVNTGADTAGAAASKDLDDVINAYLVNDLDDAEVNFIVANLGTKYRFQIGVGDNRVDNTDIISRFVIVTNWDGTGNNAETAEFTLLPKITPNYNHKMTFVKSTKKITVSDTHVTGADANRYGSIRYFKVLQIVAPGAPTGVTATAKAGSITELDVSFTAGSSAASHTLKWKVSTAQTYAAADTATVTGAVNSYTIPGLSVGTTYDVEVTAVNASGTTPATAVQGTTGHSFAFTGGVTRAGVTLANQAAGGPTGRPLGNINSLSVTFTGTSVSSKGPGTPINGATGATITDWATYIGSANTTTFWIARSDGPAKAIKASLTYDATANTITAKVIEAKYVPGASSINTAWDTDSAAQSASLGEADNQTGYALTDLTVTAD